MINLSKKFHQNQFITFLSYTAQQRTQKLQPPPHFGRDGNDHVSSKCRANIELDDDMSGTIFYTVKPCGVIPSSCLLSSENGGMRHSNVLLSCRSILNVPLQVHRKPPKYHSTCYTRINYQ